MSKTKTHAGYYYPLFKFFSEEHNLTLLDSDIQEIMHQVQKFTPSERMPSDEEIEELGKHSFSQTKRLGAVSPYVDGFIDGFKSHLQTECFGREDMVEFVAFIDRDYYKKDQNSYILKYTDINSKSFTYSELLNQFLKEKNKT